MYHRHREAAQSMSGPWSAFSATAALHAGSAIAKNLRLPRCFLRFAACCLGVGIGINCSSFTGLYPPLFSFFSRFLLYGILLLLRGLLELLYAQLALSIKYWAHEVVELTEQLRLYEIGSVPAALWASYHYWKRGVPISTSFAVITSKSR